MNCMTRAACLAAAAAMTMTPVASARADEVTTGLSPAILTVAAGYRTSDWSPWTRAEGVEYRYRWGWNPDDRKYATDVNAIFEIRNRTTKTWQGAARTLHCSQNVLSRSKDVTLRASETRQVTFLTPNCGTLRNPSFKANVVRSGRID